MGALNARPRARSGADAHAQETYRQSPPAVPDAPPLSPGELQELIGFFRGYEAAIGYRSSYGAMIAAAAGGARGASSWDEELTERLGAAMAAHHRVYRALRRMVDRGQGPYVSVLYRLFGDRPPSADYTTFEELAPLVAFTATGEALARAARVSQPGLGMDGAISSALRVAVDARLPADVRTAKRRAADVRRAASVAAIRLEAQAIRTAAAIAYRDARRGRP